jgi:hypothetical protein
VPAEARPEVEDLHRTRKLDAANEENKGAKQRLAREMIWRKTNENTDFHSSYSNSRSKMPFGHGNAGDL